MQKHEIEMWETKIENAASRVAAELGSNVVVSVFSRYDAHGLYDLPSCYFSEVFADLEMMVADY